MKKLIFIFAVCFLGSISMAMVPAATKEAKPLPVDKILPGFNGYVPLKTKCFKCPNGATRDGRAGNWSWSICYVNGAFHHVDVCYDFFFGTECISVSIVVVGGQVAFVEPVGPTNEAQETIINRMNNNVDGILDELSLFIALSK